MKANFISVNSSSSSLNSDFSEFSLASSGIPLNFILFLFQHLISFAGKLFILLID